MVLRNMLKLGSKLTDLIQELLYSPDIGYGKLIDVGVIFSFLEYQGIFEPSREI